MQADNVELLWDDSKSKWLVRIQIGEEVIRRFCNLPKGADERALQQAAQETLKDEGFEATQAVAIQRAAS